MRETSLHRNSGGLSLETTPVENSQKSGQTPNQEVQCNCSNPGCRYELSVAALGFDLICCTFSLPFLEVYFLLTMHHISPFEGGNQCCHTGSQPGYTGQYDHLR